jgi:hypothetical protein
MPTKLERKYISFSQETLNELDWLLEDERKKRKRARKKGNFYECHLLAQMTFITK